MGRVDGGGVSRRSHRVTALPVSMLVVLLGMISGLCSPVTAAEPPAAVSLAVTGTNGALYTRTATTGWVNLGGILIDAPAVAHVSPTLTQYVGIGGNGFLYQRTQATGWRRLTVLDYRCTQVSMIRVPFSTTIAGACTASNGAAYSFSFDGAQTAPSTALTKISDNNQVSGRVAVEFWDGELYYLAVGPDYVVDGVAGNVWQRYNGAWEAAGLTSVNPPGADDEGWYEAFQQADGTIAISCYADGGSDYVIGGRSIGAPTLVVNADDTAELLVTGTNYGLYRIHLSPDGTANGAWERLSGATPYGPAAVSTLADQ